MLTLTCCQDHILTENIWFVCSETSYSGVERRCYYAWRRTNKQLKIELLSQWKLEAESRNVTLQDLAKLALPKGCNLVLQGGHILVQGEGSEEGRSLQTAKTCRSCRCTPNASVLLLFHYLYLNILGWQYVCVLVYCGSPIGQSS